MAREWRQGELNGLVLIAGGASLVILSVGGFYLGRLLDRALGTGYQWAITGLLVGTLVGFWELFRIAMGVMRQQPPPPPPLDEEDEEAENNFADGEGNRE